MSISHTLHQFVVLRLQWQKIMREREFLRCIWFSIIGSEKPEPRGYGHRCFMTSMREGGIESQCRRLVTNRTRKHYKRNITALQPPPPNKNSTTNFQKEHHRRSYGHNMWHDVTWNMTYKNYVQNDHFSKRVGRLFSSKNFKKKCYFFSFFWLRPPVNTITSIAPPTMAATFTVIHGKTVKQFKQNQCTKR